MVAVTFLEHLFLYLPSDRLLQALADYLDSHGAGSLELRHTVELLVACLPHIILSYRSILLCLQIQQELIGELSAQLRHEVLAAVLLGGGAHLLNLVKVRFLLVVDDDDGGEVPAGIGWREVLRELLSGDAVVHAIREARKGGQDLSIVDRHGL